MGLKYISYRVLLELERKTGILKKRHPINPVKKTFISLEEWKKSEIAFVIDSRERLQIDKFQDPDLEKNAAKILSGQICFFSSEWKNLGKTYDWISNPDTNYTYKISNHWSEINDFNPENGDIKYVWEKSRFTYLHSIIRYDYHFDKDHSEFVFTEIENWIDANPINQGPNWKCSQEISLRLFNWMYALIFYKNSNCLSKSLWEKIQNTIFWSLHHIFHHINFSRIAVRNNHAITETLALTVSEMLFPYIPETKKWAKKGRKWFEKEVNYQIYNDGTFLQFSMNYNRVLVQLLSFGIAITEKNKKIFSKNVYAKAYKTVNFLFQCMQIENGYLPNYGNNDGALFFQFSNKDYRDYRPQVNTLHRILTGSKLFDDHNINEDYNWAQNESQLNYKFDPLKQEIGVLSFTIGGYYICRTLTSFSFIRCGNHKDRPAHADNLHLDIWVNGKNVLRDSGTYKYNTSKNISNYFTGSSSHNTVVVNEESQMLKGSNFIWYYWTQCNNAYWGETADYYIFKGKIKAYTHLNKKATHFREVIISKKSEEWIVKDEIKNLENFSKRQVWHGDFEYLKFNNTENKIENEVSYDSTYYGKKSESMSISFQFESQIETQIKYNT